MAGQLCLSCVAIIQSRQSTSSRVIAKSLYSNSFGLARFKREKSLSLLNKFLPMLFAANHLNCSGDLYLDEVRWAMRSHVVGNHKENP